MGSITATELGQLNFNNVPLGVELARRLLGVFDKDRSGTISFQEYASLQQYLNTLKSAFYGSNPSKFTITSGEIIQVLQRLGFSISPTAIQIIIQKFDAQRRGALSWDQYMNMCAHLAFVRSVFEWSDTDHDGKTTFDYEQFIYATLYI